MRAISLIAAGLALALVACQPSGETAQPEANNAVTSQPDTPQETSNEDNGKKVNQGSTAERVRQETQEALDKLKDEVNVSSVYKYIETHPDYTYLFKALSTTHYAKRLHNESLTIFAPTNKAFEAMPQAALDHLYANENDAAREQFIARHVVERAYTSEKIDRMEDLLSLDGGRLHFGEDKEGPIEVNGVEMPRMHLQLGKSILISTDQVLPVSVGK